MRPTLFSMVCSVCSVETTRWSDMSNFTKCDCGGVLHKKYGAAKSDGDFHHVSESLGIHPSQVAEHKRLYPDVGIRDNGVIDYHGSVRGYDKYLNARGMVKHPQKIK